MFDPDTQDISFFISSLTSDNSVFCETVGSEARKSGVPVIRRESEGFLKMILELKKPGKILEIGTAVGYSALIMAENTSESCMITTIEIDEEDARIAVENLSKAGYSDRVRVITGDAARILPDLEAGFDLVFLDASKGQYLKFFNEIRKLLSPGGVVVSDNVLQGGNILRSRFIIEQRDRTVHKRMREFLYEITHDEDFVTGIVPVGDGIAVSVLKTNE